MHPELRRSLEKERQHLREMNGNGEAAANGGGGAMDFWKRKDKKALKKEKKLSKKRAKAAAKKKGAENGEGLAELAAAPMETITKGKLRVSPHKKIPVDSKGAYLVVPAEVASASGSPKSDSGEKRAKGEGEATRSSAASVVSAASKWVGRLFATAESVPLVVGAAGTVLVGLGHSFLQARGSSTGGGGKA
mmetsp:Transcript_9232/g.18493  ORF Transcript_9232/g.18493 Transcript_9232/m.18493 type:complete len:191 (+) Transcript_9232:52-624(+)